VEADHPDPEHHNSISLLNSQLQWQLPLKDCPYAEEPTLNLGCSKPVAIFIPFLRFVMLLTKQEKHCFSHNFCSLKVIYKPKTDLSLLIFIHKENDEVSN